MATTNIIKALEAAADDWDHDRREDSVEFTRREVTENDGYPHTAVVTHDPSGLITGGHVFTDYGEGFELGDGPYELGSRSLMGVLSNVNNPFRYATFFEAWVARNPATLSEKLLAKSIGESERQIRNARIMGYMDGYLADKLAIKVLGMHPSNLFGTPGWLETDAPGAWPKERKRRG